MGKMESIGINGTGNPLFKNYVGLIEGPDGNVMPSNHLPRFYITGPQMPEIWPAKGALRMYFLMRRLEVVNRWQEDREDMKMESRKQYKSTWWRLWHIQFRWTGGDICPADRRKRLALVAGAPYHSKWCTAFGWADRQSGCRNGTEVAWNASRAGEGNGYGDTWPVALDSVCNGLWEVDEIDLQLEQTVRISCGQQRKSMPGQAGKKN